MSDETRGICIACKELIKDGATKCKHCGTGQSWRSHLQFSSTILALIVALLSVLSIMIHVVAQTFGPNDAILKCVVKDVLTDMESKELDGTATDHPSLKFDLTCFNLGPKAGIIKDIYLVKKGSNSHARLTGFNSIIQPSSGSDFIVMASVDDNLIREIYASDGEQFNAHDYLIKIIYIGSSLEKHATIADFADIEKKLTWEQVIAKLNKAALIRAAYLVDAMTFYFFQESFFILWDSKTNGWNDIEIFPT